MNQPDEATTRPSPLAGQTVLITRAAHQSAAFAKLLTHREATAVFQPAIEIVGPDSWEMADSLIKNLAEYARLVFVSGNAVKFFLDRVIHQQQMEALKALAPEIVAIGSGTGAVIESYGLAVSGVPENSNSQSLAKMLVENRVSTNTAIFRADRGSAVLGDRLAEEGIDFEEVVIYRSQDVLQPDPAVFDEMANSKIHWTTITSSAIGESIVNQFGDALRQTKIATISPTTTAAMERLGFTVAAEAARYDLDGMISAMESYQGDRR
jgi:uroporphyrinogen-III synthase